MKQIHINTGNFDEVNKRYVTKGITPTGMRGILVFYLVDDPDADIDSIIGDVITGFKENDLKPHIKED